MHRKGRWYLMGVILLAVSSGGKLGALAADRGYFLDHDEVLRRGGVGNYLFHNSPIEPGESAPPHLGDVESTWIDVPSQQAGLAGNEAELVGALAQLNAKLYFDRDSARVKAASEELGSVARLLQSQKSLQVEVDGYADAAGSEDHNLRLSQARAEAVKKALMAQGVSHDQILIKAWGESHQMPGENNRRVELKRLAG